MELFAGHEFHRAAEPQPKAISPQRRGERGGRAWERTLPACLRFRDYQSTQDACAPRGEAQIRKMTWSRNNMIVKFARVLLPGLLIITSVPLRAHATEENGAEKPRPFTFARAIEGILTMRGCNDATCHGGGKGRGGFKLSVYGIYPREDYKWIVEGGTFRVLTTDDNPKHSRIELKQPEKSLLLLKPTFSVPHGGGLRFQVDSGDYETILTWVRSGAPYGEEAEKEGVTVERVEVSPKDVVLQARGRQQLIVTAYLSNGQREDITEQVRSEEHTSELQSHHDIVCRLLL